MTDFSVFSPCDLEDFQEVYNIHVENHGSEDDIIWITQDGCELTLGSMVTTHVENTRDYFLSSARRHISRVAMLEDHLVDNPNDPSRDNFIDEIENCERFLKSHNFIAFMMMKQLERRKALRKPKKRDSMGLTLIDKLGKLRDRKLKSKMEDIA